MNPWLDSLSFLALILGLFAVLACVVGGAEWFISWRARPDVPRETYGPGDQMLADLAAARLHTDSRRAAAIVVEPARQMTRADHLAIEKDPEPVEIQADFRRDVPRCPSTGLKFHPHMTLIAAARIAGERGMTLSLEWSKLGGLKVVAIRRR